MDTLLDFSLSDEEVKYEVFRILDPRYLWHRAWHLRRYAGIRWEDMNLVPDHRIPWQRPIKPLAESTCRIHGKKGQKWEHLWTRPLLYFLPPSACKALRALKVDPGAEDAVDKANQVVRSYMNKRLPKGVGWASFVEILNVLDDLNEAPRHS